MLLVPVLFLVDAIRVLDAALLLVVVVECDETYMFLLSTNSALADARGRFLFWNQEDNGAGVIIIISQCGGHSVVIITNLYGKGCCCCYYCCCKWYEGTACTIQSVLNKVTIHVEWRGKDQLIVFTSRGLALEIAIALASLSNWSILRVSTIELFLIKFNRRQTWVDFFLCILFTSQFR